MPVGLALALLAQTASVPPATADPAPTPASAPKPAVRQDGCTNPAPTADTQQIVICAPKSDGYRLNPDIMAAKRAMRSGGPLRRPENFKTYPCQSVGPAPCLSPGVNLISAALTAAEMAKRVAQGKEVGSMFVTDPHPDEYHLYLAAKARREAREADDALAKAKKAKADAAARTAAQTKPDADAAAKAAAETKPDAPK